MRVLLLAFVLFISAAFAAEVCEHLISGPYICNDGHFANVQFDLDLTEETVVITYPEETNCNVEATAFEHDGDLIVTNVKCYDKTDCKYLANFDCLPFIIEDVEFNDEEECLDFHGEVDDEDFSCTADFVVKEDEDSASNQFLPIFGFMGVLLFALA